MLANINFRTQAIKVLWITVAWTMISIFQFLMTYTSILQMNIDITGLIPSGALKTSIVTGIMAGLIGGSTVVFFWEKWLRTKAYGWSILNILWSFSLVYIMVSLVGGGLFHSQQLQVSYFHPEVWSALWAHYTPIVLFSHYFFWLFVVILTLIALQVNDKYGPGVFGSFLLGKYFHPKREERIFMFLDLRGSTGIAEKLGESAYFNFLKDLFRDVTPGILAAKGEIYQYVGDEIVVSWKKSIGTAKANCLQCYFNIQKILREKAPYYQKHYNGLIPEFKAGLHSGYVMVGEIGIVKREIAYSGDVLNTAARIQDKCNELGVNILLSKNLKERLKSLPESLKVTPIGELSLRGKRKAVMLYTL